MPDFATIAQPVHHLTEKTVPFAWNVTCQCAFKELKEKLTMAPILAFPDFGCTFLLDTDASENGIGAVLSQVVADGRERIVAYASRVLSKPEHNSCVIRCELLAVVFFHRLLPAVSVGHSHCTRITSPLHGSRTSRSFRNS